ncbi:type II secretion system F family protein [Rhizobiaceae bacterium]|nr:type II secretion system F family protein [Rhizobiaceae bacterium]
MDFLTPTFFAVIGLATVMVFALGYALFYTSIETQKKASGRMKAMQVDRSEKVSTQNKKVDEKQRRKMREETLKAVGKQRAAGKTVDNPPFDVKLMQAGMTISVKKFTMICIVISLVLFFVLFVIVKAPIYVALGVAFAGGLGVPRKFVSMKRDRRFRKFTMIFPNAIDVIVRGIRSGLPLNDCLRIIAQDSDEPVRGEFRKMLEATQMGISVPDACERLYKAIPTSETNFFSIVIAIQSSAGGNLSEALSGLSKVLRERRAMADKIKAVSAEAKMSAIIIGSLPIIVAILIHLSSPGYMDQLFITETGNKILAACFLSMLGGALIMKKMINFKF